MNMETTYIQTDIKHVRRFLDACDGNWHHCIHVTCPSCKTSGICRESGFLFHPDATAEPLILPLSDARILFSCYPEPEECIMLDPATAYQKLTGIYDEEVTEDVVYKQLIDTIIDEMHEHYKKYLKEAIEIKCKKEEAEKKLNEKLENLKLPLPCGEEDQADGKMQAWMDKTILFTENPRNIQKVVFSQKGKMLNMRLVINDEEKTCDAGFKTWIRNDLYQDDYTKKHHCISYAFEKNRLNISVGLINTSYREEYCFCVDKDKLVCTSSL